MVYRIAARRRVVVGYSGTSCYRSVLVVTEFEEDTSVRIKHDG